jgi:transcriptional regulator with XRE-family HTH domain
MSIASPSPESNLGAIIRALRKSLNLTQAEFGVLTGVTVHAVHQWETNHHQPRPQAAARMLGAAHDNGQSEFARQLASLANITVRNAERIRTLEVFSLPEGTVSMEWPGALSPDSFEELSAWLDLMKRKIKRGIVLAP